MKFRVYWYWCGSHEITLETNTWKKMWPPAGQSYLRNLAVFPLILVLFISFPKKPSITILVLILLFSAILMFRIPFHFHYNVHQPAFNWQTTYHALVADLIMAVGLLAYYRFISKRLNVYPRYLVMEGEGRIIEFRAPVPNKDYVDSLLMKYNE